MRRARFVAPPIVAATLAACGGSSAPPTVAKRETPAEHIHRIGTVWEERTAADGFMSPPSDIDRFRIESRMELTIGDPAATTAKELVERTETFTMRNGRTYHCSATASTTARVAYAWRGTQPELRLDSPAVLLARRCAEPGYPYPEKRLDPATVTFVLRDDRLVAVEPPLAKSVLVPIR